MTPPRMSGQTALLTAAAEKSDINASDGETTPSDTLPEEDTAAPVPTGLSVKTLWWVIAITCNVLIVIVNFFFIDKKKPSK